MTALIAAWIAGSLGVGCVVLAISAWHTAPRRSAVYAYVHADDVARFEREGWYVTGQDPRYRTVIMRRDTVGDAPARSVRLTEGVRG